MAIGTRHAVWRGWQQAAVTATGQIYLLDLNTVGNEAVTTPQKPQELVNAVQSTKYNYRVFPGNLQKRN